MTCFNLLYTDILPGRCFLRIGFNYKSFLFHFNVILPHKVKRRRKIPGRDTLKCPSLNGLQKGEYRRMKDNQDVLDTLTRK